MFPCHHRRRRLPAKSTKTGKSQGVGAGDCPDGLPALWPDRGRNTDCGEDGVKYDPRMHHRRSIRLRDYDYSQAGGYFITICTHERQCLFGEITDGKMVMNQFGDLADQLWVDLDNRFPNIELNEYVIMPNHMHGIINIHGDNSIVEAGFTHAPIAQTYGFTPAPIAHTNGFAPAQTDQINRTTVGATARVAPTVGDIVGAYKSRVANEYLRIYKSKKIYMGKLWQRNYYEHIIRSETELNRIRQYIINNPLNWQTDENFTG